MKVLPLLSCVALTMVVLVSCEKEPPNTVITNPIPPTTIVTPSSHKIVSPYFFQIVFGGVDTVTLQTMDTTTIYVNVAEDLCACEVKDSINGMEEVVGFHYSIASAVWPQKAINNPKPENNINVGGIAFSHVGLGPIDDLFTYQNIIKRDSLKEGNYDWGRTATTNLKDNGDDGVSVFYIDETGQRWGSDRGLTWQPDGYFVVNSYEENTEGGAPWRLIDAKFKCRMYNDSGAVKFGEGIFRGKIVTWPN